MKTYRVLWFDDEWSTLELINDIALKNGINLNGYDNAQDGLAELEKNFYLYDAVIVDGKFYNKPRQSGDAVDDNAFALVARTLDKWINKKVIPWFVLSGQVSFTKEKNKLLEIFKDGKVYDKNSDEDIQALWDDIKKEADLQIETNIRHKYQKVFDVCKEEYIGESAQNHLITILKSLESQVVTINDDLYFNQLRIILEYLFRAANRYGLLHDKCIDSGLVILSSSSQFLSGMEVNRLDIKCKKSHFPKLISNHVRLILDVTNAASHTNETDVQSSKINLSEYRNTNNTPYLLYSLTFALMDVLVWFKVYVEQNPDVAKNKSLWVDILPVGGIADEEIGGVVLEIHPKGFAFLKPKNGNENLYIPPAIVSKYGLKGKEHVMASVKKVEKGTEVMAIRFL